MKIKRITALILCLTMLVCAAFASAVCTSAASEATLNGTYSVEEGKLTLTLTLGSNPGINTLVAKLAYNADALTLDSVTNGKVFSEENGGSMFETNTANNPLTLYFEENGIGNITANGVVATLVFTVNAESDDYGFVLAVDSNNTYACGEGIVPVDVPFAASAVTEFKGIPGDINGDGKVNAIDSNFIKRIILNSIQATPTQKIAADLNSDGKINSMDSALLKRKIMGA